MKIKTLQLVSVCIGTLVAQQAANAVNLDLTTAGASGFINGAFFEQIDPQSTGSGVIDPFLRIQATGTEHGFNNNVDAFTLDDVAKGGQTFNHDILLSSVPIVTIGGVDYYQFLLDVNEPNGTQSKVTLHELEIWLKADPITTLAGKKGVYSDLSGSGAVLTYDLDGLPDGDSEIELDYDLNAGSGSGDMFANIPVSVLGTDDKYVYLYSAFGNPTPSGDGFEEWATVGESTPPPPPPVPDGGATVGLLAIALFAIEGMRRKLGRN